MREIKFRGYDGMDWIYGSAIEYIKEVDFWYIIEEGAPDDDWVIVNRVGQYTGLKDQNGKEIYEGDIVQGRSRMDEDWILKQEVTYLNGCYMFGNWNAHEYFNKHTEIKVVGNIYENQELLTK